MANKNVKILILGPAPDSLDEEGCDKETDTYWNEAMNKYIGNVCIASDLEYEKNEIVSKLGLEGKTRLNTRINRYGSFYYCKNWYKVLE